MQGRISIPLLTRRTPLNEADFAAHADHEGLRLRFFPREAIQKSFLRLRSDND